MSKFLSLPAASVVLVLVTGGCSLFDVSYDSKSTEYKEDTGSQSRIEMMERRLERLEREIEGRR